MNSKSTLPEGTVVNPADYEQFTILARMFSEKPYLKVSYVVGATPSTKEGELTLPAELPTTWDSPKVARFIYALLANIGHECCGHQQYTAFSVMQEYEVQGKKSYKTCINVLEDIRVDFKVMEKFDKAKDFYHDHADSLFETPEKIMGMMQDSAPIKVLKAMILKNMDYDFSKYPNVFDSKVIEIYKEVEPYIEKARKAKDTFEIKLLAKELEINLKVKYAEEFDEMNEPKEGHNQEEDEDSEAQAGFGEDDGEGEESSQDSDNESEGSQNDKGGKPSKKPMKLSINKDVIGQPGIFGETTEISPKELAKKIKEAIEQLDKTTEDIKKANEQAVKDRNAAKSSHRRTSLNNTKLRKLEYAERYDPEFKNDPTNKEKLENKRKEVNLLNEEYKKLYDQYRKSLNALHELQHIKSGTQTKRNIMEKVFDHALEGGFDSTDGATTVMGFDSYKSEDFQNLRDEGVTAKKVKLDEAIRDALIRKHEKSQDDEDGSKINFNKIDQLYTSPENMFFEPCLQEDKTLISFVIDVSGSMGQIEDPTTVDMTTKRKDYPCYEPDRATIAVAALNIIAVSLKKAIDMGAPADFVVYGFGTNVGKMIKNSEDYSTRRMFEKYSEGRNAFGGSTNIQQAVNHVTEEIKEDFNFNHRCMVIITDADVSDDVLKELRNAAKTDGIKYIFVSIKNERDCKETRELFGKNNITDITEATHILYSAMCSAAELY